MNLTEIKTSIGQSGFTLNQLNEISIILAKAKEMAALTSLSVGSEVYVIQSTKKTLGTVTKINKTRALVKMIGVGDFFPMRNSVYRVPLTMLEAA